MSLTAQPISQAQATTRPCAASPRCCSASSAWQACGRRCGTARRRPPDEAAKSRPRQALAAAERRQAESRGEAADEHHPPSTFQRFLEAALPAAAEWGNPPFVLTIADAAGMTGLLPQFVASLRRASPELARLVLVVCVTPEAHAACSESSAKVCCCTCRLSSVAPDHGPRCSSDVAAARHVSVHPCRPEWGSCTTQLAALRAHQAHSAWHAHAGALLSRRRGRGSCGQAAQGRGGRGPKGAPARQGPPASLTWAGPSWSACWARCSCSSATCWSWTWTLSWCAPAWACLLDPWQGVAWRLGYFAATSVSRVLLVCLCSPAAWHTRLHRRQRPENRVAEMRCARAGSGTRCRRCATWRTCRSRTTAGGPTSG